LISGLIFFKGDFLDEDANVEEVRGTEKIEKEKTEEKYLQLYS